MKTTSIFSDSPVTSLLTFASGRRDEDDRRDGTEAVLAEMSRQRDTARASPRETKKSAFRRGVRSSSEDGQAQPGRPRPHTCTYCQKTFIRAEHLIRHVASHENRKPFKCPPCGASFGRTDVLRRHQKKCPGKPPQGSPRLQHEESRIQTSTENDSQVTVDDALMLEANCRPVDHNQQQSKGLIAAENSDVIRSQTDEISIVHLAVSQSGGSSHDAIVVRQSGDEDTAESELSSPLSNADQGLAISKAHVAPDTTISAQQVNEIDRLNQTASLDNPESTTSENNPGSGEQHVDIPDFLMLGDTFISEINPGDFDMRGVTDLMFDFNANTVISPPSEDTCILLDPSRHVVPVSLFFDAPESLPQYRPSRDTPHLFRCSDDDAIAVNNAFAKAKGNTISTSDTGCLSHSQILRWINAYFEHFDIHTPIVHRSTFIISATPGRQHSQQSGKRPS
ncbi:uncharacterized protein BDZ83DRAFT_130425 [Colletotrichum acutatum]|uniref:C2H2-type domain-containing protein n=1 Tax=Glomerella acutata TaxID=27357 RepID=A0AAD8XJM6_GLOAC|nr:uncharacterized protein BDZ83DRAFT_130425 [Colletotrichum acutatum]KAK1728518.1 hypothetical protein BDZ83DRAFT_130425 [Colletotrichum acutatum]